MLIIVVPLVEAVAAEVPVYDSECSPWVSSPGVLLSDRTTWPQRRCLVVYVPPRVNGRALSHWLMRFGYSVALLKWWKDDDPLRFGKNDSQVFIGHGDIVSVRRSLASQGLQCLEWAHLREPRMRLFSHIAHLHSLGSLQQSMTKFVDLYRGFAHTRFCASDERHHGIHNHDSLFNTMTYTFIPKELMFLEKADEEDEDEVNKAFKVVLSLGGFSLSTNSLECALRAWVDYLGPPAGNSLVDGDETEAYFFMSGTEGAIMRENGTQDPGPDPFKLMHVGGWNTDWMFNSSENGGFSREDVESLFLKDKLWGNLIEPMIKLDQNLFSMLINVEGYQSWWGQRKICNADRILGLARPAHCGC